MLYAIAIVITIAIAFDNIIVIYSLHALKLSIASKKVSGRDYIRSIFDYNTKIFVFDSRFYDCAWWVHLFVLVILLIDSFNCSFLVFLERGSFTFY